MRAIILAAGTGSRLGDMTKHKTKGMVRLNGKPLIEYILEYINHDDFEEIIVVGGFCYEELSEHIESLNYSRVRVIQNKEYLKGNIYTLITALNEFMGDSFLITNVDHVYPPVMYKKMSKSFQKITAMCDFDRQLGQDDMKVKLNSDGKTISGIAKTLGDYDCGYIGMTYVDVDSEKLYRSSIKKAIQQFGDKAVVENVLQILAQEKTNNPKICDLSGFGWYEIDTVDELVSAEKKILKDEHFK